ncbi:MAG: ribonuclease P protein component [Verrucomicrobia bacterium]|nr:ribonuclease P protein component [Verrucomicrobiota bacterium]
MTNAAGSRRTPGPDQRLGRPRRLIRSALFREAYDQGRRHFGRFMVLWLRSGEGASLRLGVVTGRKVGEAVERTRARRRLREVFRRHRHLFEGAWDVVLVGRRAVVDASWADLSAELLTLARRAGLLRGDAPAKEKS